MGTQLFINEFAARSACGAKVAEDAEELFFPFLLRGQKSKPHAFMAK
jgi:hypothetical protein